VSQFSALLPRLGEIANEAGQIAQKARSSPTRELKPDGSIVTNGDCLVETFLRKELKVLLPDSAVWGEEYGFSEEGTAGLWLVDPIDGTSNYSYGSPMWGVSIAFVRGSEIELGAVALPDLKETYLAAKGLGVTANGTRLQQIPPGAIKNEELVSYSDRVLKICPVVPGKMRASGAFVIDGCFVASQRFRGLVGVREKLYDVAACVLFGLELGADIRYADGQPFNLKVLKKDVKIAKPWVIFPSQSKFVV
jgi:myo-inositol-1(or 4)-monophosphatase